MARPLSAFAVRQPRLTLILAAALTLLLAAGIAVPMIFPGVLPLPALKVDTNPENMLPADEEVRVFHNAMKETFALSDLLVVGVVNEEHPQGVWNAASLERVLRLTDFAKTLRGEVLGEEDPRAGVLDIDLIAPSTIDYLEQAGPGTVRFDWLMAEAPADDAQALEIRDRAQRQPFLDGTLLSEDGQALALYIPLSSKELSHRVSTLLQEFVAGLDGDDEFMITGLPVAEDTFGVQMFIQMAISAPMAMLLIFILLLLFFRRLQLCTLPMLVALASVICTMSLLILSGQTVHIMSSMIPIFIMPIAVLDSIHILSELFDRARTHPGEGRRSQVLAAMKELSAPMLYTSLTSAAGFASLALTPIPPVRVFGIFVAIGVMFAWAMTVTLIPAAMMVLPAKRIAGFGSHGSDHGGLGGVIRFFASAATHRSRLVLALSLVAAAVAVWGISQIRVNDNPIRWFHQDHPIRVADRVLNEHFGGTYMAYLALSDGIPSAAPEAPEETPQPEGSGDSGEPALPAGLGAGPDLNASQDAGAEPDLPPGLGGLAPVPSAGTSLTAPSKETAEAYFKNPEALRYLEDLQAHLGASPVVGKSNSLADLVKTVHRELKGGGDAELRVPDTAAAVAQSLVQFESGHRPHDLWHFVTPDYRAANIWLQMRSGDNQDMAAIEGRLADYLDENPPPYGLEANWFGLTYINLVWQEKMVMGMLEAFAGSFLVVFLMMSLLFRSFRWGFLSMIPMVLTIGLIYGLIGIIGRDYDMPVAVLSCLALGLAIDFAIHFLTRSREAYQELGDWRKARAAVFGAPARAIVRNVLVIAVGFLPLLAAPLVPYNAVGVLMALILFTSGVATLTVLPAILETFQGPFFRSLRRKEEGK